MKKSLLTIAVSMIAAGAFAQGTVNFGNISGTGLPAGVAGITNSVTGARVPVGTTFTAALYGGPAGSAESALVQVGATSGFSSAGLFSGGTRTLDASLLTGQQATLQVRVWQTSLGASWESALQTANSGGHLTESLGGSALFTLTTGNPNANPPGTPANLLGFRGFVIHPVPEPSTLGLAGLGLAALAFLRRRK